MYTVIYYILKAEGKEHKMAGVHLTCEADLTLKKLYSDTRVSGLNSCKFDTYEDAAEVRNKLRNLDLS